VQGGKAAAGDAAQPEVGSKASVEAEVTPLGQEGAPANDVKSAAPVPDSSSPATAPQAANDEQVAAAAAAAANDEQVAAAAAAAADERVAGAASAATAQSLESSAARTASGDTVASATSPQTKVAPAGVKAIDSPRPAAQDSDDPTMTGSVTEKQLVNANPMLAERSIYYDFDKYDIKEQYAHIVEAHAHFLVEHPTLKIFVEGNCDDRGSPEYNLVLGQRRAESVLRALMALGVSARQIEAVSFGAERPLAPGHDEESWAKNRRSDIVYPIKGK
jgi:peptidoglycan-associated lipoprotein